MYNEKYVGIITTRSVYITGIHCCSVVAERSDVNVDEFMGLWKKKKREKIIYIISLRSDVSSLCCACARDVNAVGVLNKKKPHAAL